jgi:spermidine synthase
MADLTLFEKDPYAPIRYAYQVTDVLYRGRSEYQEFAVVTNPFFGRMLVLDGVVQFTERDEFYYHEMLAHVPLHALAAPRRVIVIGGGDGGVVREVLKHPSVEKVFLVDIDPEVGRVSREYFPTVASGLSDPRVVEAPMDGARFLSEFEGTADAILVDSTDIVGFAKSLFTAEFFGAAGRVLGRTGLFATLSESIHFHLPIVREVQRTLLASFAGADLYTAPIATYAGNWWCFAVGSNGADVRSQARPAVTPTRYYCDEVHRACFLPKVLYDRLMEEGRESL